MKTAVLVVEDNRANMKLATLLLSHAGYEVLQAESAAEGLVLARERQPALILMDIQLPGMDGLEATRIIKADPATRDIKVVALTAFAMAGDEARIRAAGCDGYLAKPIDYRQFLVEVRCWLDSGETRA
ncbi:MAG: response regulator [Rhodocyclales bacterium]|nr:response regulator [Rhodocyclales bacterium]MBI5785177.1 response regulator [Rhodocyclales bacterium]